MTRRPKNSSKKNAGEMSVIPLPDGNYELIWKTNKATAEKLYAALNVMAEELGRPVSQVEGIDRMLDHMLAKLDPTYVREYPQPDPDGPLHTAELQALADANTESQNMN